MATVMTKNSGIPCARCGGSCVEFTVPNDVWNTVIRLGGKERDDEYICEVCYRHAVEDFVRAATLVVPADVLEALTSAYESAKRGELDGWEMSLIERRLLASLEVIKESAAVLERKA